MKLTMLLLIPWVFAAVAAAQGSPDNHMADMQKRMQEMQAQMDKIEQTRDPAERARLLARHREAMREELHSMQHMDEANMRMGTGMGMGKDGGMMECHAMMTARMDLVNGMMDQMLRHEAAEHAPPK